MTTFFAPVHGDAIVLMAYKFSLIPINDSMLIVNFNEKLVAKPSKLFLISIGVQAWVLGQSSHLPMALQPWAKVALLEMDTSSALVSGMYHSHMYWPYNTIYQGIWIILIGPIVHLPMAL